jgi:protein-disulfide isomerase
VDDSSVNQGPEGTGAEVPAPEPTPDAPEAAGGVAEPAAEFALAAPPAGGGVARVIALIGLGLLAGLGAGWVLFHEEPQPAAAVAGASGGADSYGVDVTNDPTMGPPDAPITIVEFSDFDCPFCTRFASQTAPALRRHYGDRIRWVFVNLPLQAIHPRAYEAALAGECAHEEGRFWEWYDAMFSGRFDSSGDGLRAAALDIGLDGDAFAQCLEDADHASEVAADLREAQKFYILGTPTFYINGLRLEGAQPPEAFAAVIDSLLAGS